MTKIRRLASALGARAQGAWRVCACLVACVLSPGLRSQPGREPVDVDVQEKRGILVAALWGRHDLLQDVAETAPKPFERDLAAAMAARASGHLDISDEAVKQCLKDVADATDGERAAFNLLCGQVYAGNKFLRGDYQGWAMIALGMVKATDPYFRILYKDQPYTIRTFKGVDLASVQGSGPATTLTPVPKDTRLLRIGTASGFHYGTFRATGLYITQWTINGTTLAAIFDTGAVVSTLDRVEANRLALPVAAPRFLTLGRDAGGAGVAVDLRQVREVELGAASLGEIRIASGSVPNVIGLDLIRALGTIKVSDTGVLVLGQGAPLPCATPATFASDWLGNYKLIARMKVQGKLSQVFIDTGDDGPLTVFEAHPSTLDPSAIYKPVQVTVAGGTEQWQVRTTDADLDGHRVTLRHVVGKGGNFDYSLGAGVLRTLDLYLDFPRMIACVAPKELQ
jgi:predicted aspartyl protease